MSQRDAQIVARLQRGEREALTELIKRYQAPLFRFAFRLVGNREEAEDICQEVFLRCWCHIGRLRERENLRAWLYRLAANLAYDFWRRIFRQSKSPPAPRQPEAQDRVEIYQLRKMLNKLPKKQRLAVVLRVYEELSFAEVARVLGCTEVAARNNYRHGLKKLKQLLGG